MRQKHANSSCLKKPQKTFIHLCEYFSSNQKIKLALKKNYPHNFSFTSTAPVISFPSVDQHNVSLSTAQSQTSTVGFCLHLCKVILASQNKPCLYPHVADSSFSLCTCPVSHRPLPAPQAVNTVHSERDLLCA